MNLLFQRFWRGAKEKVGESLSDKGKGKDSPEEISFLPSLFQFPACFVALFSFPSPPLHLVCHVSLPLIFRLSSLSLSLPPCASVPARNVHLWKATYDEERERGDEEDRRENEKGKKARSTVRGRRGRERKKNRTHVSSSKFEKKRRGKFVLMNECIPRRQTGIK